MSLNIVLEKSTERSLATGRDKSRLTRLLVINIMRDNIYLAVATFQPLTASIRCNPVISSTTNLRQGLNQVLKRTGIY